MSNGLYAHEKAAKRALLYEAQRGLCAGCFQPMNEDAATFDHVVPRSRGGTNAIDNILLMHSLCNLKKKSQKYKHSGFHNQVVRRLAKVVVTHESGIKQLRFPHLAKDK